MNYWLRIEVQKRNVLRANMTFDDPKKDFWPQSFIVVCATLVYLYLLLRHHYDFPTKDCQSKNMGDNKTRRGLLHIIFPCIFQFLK